MVDEHQDDPSQDAQQQHESQAAVNASPNGGTNAEAAAKLSVVSRIMGTPLSIGNALVLLVILGAIIVLITLAIGPTREGSQTGINSADYARGLITLIFSGGTMLIAILLALYVITSDSPHADERFSRGKEVLTILIGVFGTILGFYFGKSDTPPVPPVPTQQAVPTDANSNPPAGANPNGDAGASQANNGGDA